MRGFAALHPPDDFEFTIRSDIPLSGGLGTSAAAIVAGLVAADSIFELGADLLAEATRLEGHPDNVAAALLGGFVLCSDGHAERFEPPPGLECLLVVPAQAVRTPRRARRCRRGSRSRTPSSTSRTPRCSCSGSPAATSAWSRAGSATASTSRAARTSIRARGSWCSSAKSLGALGATISGAGPTVLVWCDFESTGAVARPAARARARAGPRCMRVPFTATGADVRSL